VALFAALVASGCAGTVQKNFKVFADPPDADIRVVSGAELTEQTYRSPAKVNAAAPTDPALQSRAVVEVRKDNYKPVTIPLSSIADGQTLNIKLERLGLQTARYRLSYRLAGPVASDSLRYRDTIVAVSFSVADQSFQMRLENLTATEVKILWDRAQYTDENKQVHRLMHSGVRFQDRNNPIPDQIVPARATVQEAVIPVSKVLFSAQKKAYDIQPLFPLDSDSAAGLKGKSVNLFIPVEMNRQIIPYDFKIEITDSAREAIKR
jgi:hypothetical protein